MLFPFFLFDEELKQFNTFKSFKMFNPRRFYALYFR